MKWGTTTGMTGYVVLGTRHLSVNSCGSTYNVNSVGSATVVYSGTGLSFTIPALLMAPSTTTKLAYDGSHDYHDPSYAMGVAYSRDYKRMSHGSSVACGIKVNNKPYCRAKA